MNKYFLAKKIMIKINMIEIIMAKIKMITNQNG
jgi:hypothetical protein